MNVGFEDDELLPYVEPPADMLDPMRIGNNLDSAELLLPSLHSVTVLCCFSIF
jgi:hypothetical protein